MKKITLIRQAIKHRSFIRKIPALCRMLFLWLIGDYVANAKNIILPILGLIYVISPIDFIPEIAIPFVGSLDDLAILSFIIPRLVKEVDEFLLWETLRKQELRTN